MHAASPLVKHLVLVGGGHSHLAVLRHFAMRPLAGLALTLVSRDIQTPYSGAMPAYLSGQYQWQEMHIDLRPLAQFAGARLIQAEVNEIDLGSRALLLPDRPPMHFDLLSLNPGSVPNTTQIPGAQQHAIAVKPIDNFLEHWTSCLHAAVTRLRKREPYRILIVGGGPASVELAFATQSRLLKELATEPELRSTLEIIVVTAATQLLAGHCRAASQFAHQELLRRGLSVRLDARVQAFEPDGAILENGEKLVADAQFLATGASLPPWLQQSGLAISEDGFLEVDKTLQSTSHDFVFVAGDAATIRNNRRPKSGVYAVRQGKVLARNLARFATGRRLTQYQPQKRALALLSLGNKRAMALRGGLFWQGRLPWLLKHRIDSAFVRKFSRLPDMESDLELAAGLVDRQTEQALRDHAMRCAGCAAKVASDVLTDVLARLPAQPSVQPAILPQGVEDASRIDLGDGRELIQSVDFLRAFINDPWLFARIATNHCLSDLYAMGIKPHSALAIVGLPQASRRYTHDRLLELMLGCQSMLEQHDCALLGGHSAETSELNFGLSANGFSDAETPMTKLGLAVGDALLLTGPLGTGVLLAADMRHRAGHHWMQGALQQMQTTNRLAAEIFVQHGVRACTDITGFGLAGHLLEMMLPTRTRVTLNLDAIPALAGATDCLQQGLRSSLHDDNRLAAKRMHFETRLEQDPVFELLFDPQTAGGLLAGVPESVADRCLDELRDAGYEQAARIGQVTEVQADTALLSVHRG